MKKFEMFGELIIGVTGTMGAKNAKLTSCNKSTIEWLSLYDKDTISYEELIVTMQEFKDLKVKIVYAL